MARYLVLYRAETSAENQMSQASPEQAEAGMQAWMAWFGKAGAAVVDGGSPLSGPDHSIGGYSILEAGSREELDRLLEDHPHLHVGTLEAYELLQMPGAQA